MTAAAAPVALTFTSVSRTDPGARRTVNEDRVLDHPALGLWAVADGMGGHQGGAAAAARLVDALASVEQGPSGYQRLTALERKIQEVNASLFCDRKAASETGGSTVVTLLAYEGHYACLWAGDSRAYVLRDGVLNPITRDHSIVQDLVESGLLSDQDRARHPRAHMITRAVGADGEVKLDRRFAPIHAGDVFLLCSDGLTACVGDAEIAAALGRLPLAACADWLLATALDRHAPDNVSLVLVRAQAAS